MRKIEITENQRSLLQVSLEIARDKYRENASTVVADASTLVAKMRICQQFERQAVEAQELLDLFSGAEAITVEPFHAR